MFEKLKKIFNRTSVGQKVMTVIIVEVFSYTIVTTIALSQIHTVGNEVKLMADVYLPLFSSTESIRQQIQEGRLNIKEIIFVGDRVVYDQDAEETFIAARTRYNEGNRDINEEIKGAENLIRSSVERQSDSESLISQHSAPLLRQLANIRQANRIHNKRVELIFGHVEDGSFLMGMETIDEVVLSEATLTAQLDRLVAELEELKKASVSYAVKVERTASAFTILASILTVCIVVSIFFFVVKRNISKPLHMLTDVINSFNYLKAEKDSKIERQLMERGDELGMVGRSFNALKHVLWDQGEALRAAKDKAETADRAKSQFLAAASHDLRQPLHAMQMYIAALRQKVHQDDALEVISNIDAVSVSTGRMLNALLDVSQLEAGAVVPQFEDFPVQEVLRRVTRAFAPVANRKGLDLRMVKSSATVRSDAVLLERIVSNFVSNAIRYTRQGKVLIGCRRSGNNLSIEILDTGPGIPEEHAAAIFEDFRQLQNEERDKGKGLGLGLAIVRRLSSCLGHEIRHSSKIGEGSRFSISVPMGKAVAERDRATEVFTKFAGGFQDQLILLIEDDSMVLDSTQQLLESWGSEVVSARSANEAFKLVSEIERSPDMIIADYRLPGDFNGIEAVTRIQLTLGVPIPAVIISGDMETKEIKEVSELGHRFLSKPVRPAKLRTLMAHLMFQVAPETDSSKGLQKTA